WFLEQCTGRRALQVGADSRAHLLQWKVTMRSLFSRPWMLGSISPLAMLRGMLDISLQWWRESPLLGAARVSLLAAAFWGIVNLMRDPGRGIVIAGVGLLGLYALRAR